MSEVVEQEKELKEQALTIVQRATLVKITDQASYDDASKLLLEEIVPFRKRWQEYWSPVKASAWNAYKAIMGKISEMDEPAERAERAVKAEIKRWDEAQDKIRQEAQRRAQEEAEKEAAEERLRAAIVAEEAGASDAEVKAIVDSPIAVVADPVAPTYERARGLSKREHWIAVVTNFYDLVKAASKDKSLLPYLQVNQSALNKRASADKSTLNIPGVIAKDDAIISARGR